MLDFVHALTHRGKINNILGSLSSLLSYINTSEFNLFCAQGTFRDI